MEVDTKKAEEKISTSYGNTTEEYSKALESEVDQLIINTYHSEEEDDNQDESKEADEKKEPEEDESKEQEEETAKPEEEEQDKAVAKEEKEKQEDDYLTKEDQDTINDLKVKLEKSEKRVRDARTKLTKTTQELINKDNAKDAVIENLNQTIFELRRKLLEKEPRDVSDEKETKKTTKTRHADIDTEIDKLKDVDPDIVAPIKNIISGLVGQIDVLQNNLKDKVETDEKKALDNEQELHFDKLDRAHSDWEFVIDSQEFNDWISGLSSRDQRHAKRELDEGTAEEIIDLISEYKKEVGEQGDDEKELEEKKSLKKKSKIQEAKDISNPNFNKSKNINDKNTKIKFTRTMIQNMTPEDFEKHEKEIDKEMMAGRIGNE